MTASSWRHQHIIDPRFKLNQIVDVRLTVRHPVHAADNGDSGGKSSLGMPLAICSNDLQMRS